MSRHLDKLVAYMDAKHRASVAFWKFWGNLPPTPSYPVDRKPHQVTVETINKMKGK